VDAERDAARLDVLDALVAALADPAALAEIVAAASSRPDAAARLRERLGVSEAGAEAVLDTPLFRLAAPYREAIVRERDACQAPSERRPERGSGR
jgi:DNA gyrase/topoisomerase IV subunit A